MTPIPPRSAGTTAGERYLAQLCHRSFLSLWNYSNPYTDEGKKTPANVGKELCDQLVIFGNHVIIFSDKDCAYPTTEDEQVNWSRYFKKAIWKSAGQIWGAENWLKRFPNRIYEDAACQRPLRAALPPTTMMKVHRVLVTHRVSAACQAVYEGMGSLIVDTSLVGEAHFQRHPEGPTTQPRELEPFTVGHLDPARGYVHVFDDASLITVLRTLDTITDFVQYLERKEAYLLKPGRTVWAAGEEDLLAYYLRHTDAQDEHCFPADSGQATTDEEFEEGGWALFAGEELPRKLASDQVSYTWDRIIEFVTQHFESNTLHYATDYSYEAHEKALRFLAQEPRLSRRMLARPLADLMTNSPATNPLMRMADSPSHPGVRFVFLAYPRQPGLTDEQYRQQRYAYMESYCRVVKLVFFDCVDHLVGISFAGGGRAQIGNVDLFYYPAQEWAPKEHELAVAIQQKTGFLKNYKQSTRQEDEYPD